MKEPQQKRFSSLAIRPARSFARSGTQQATLPSIDQLILQKIANEFDIDNLQQEHMKGVTFKATVQEI